MSSKKKEKDCRKAALDGDVATLSAIINSGVDIEAPDPKDGQTALHYASANGHTDALGVLFKAGANLEGKDKFGFTALMIAATQGEAEVLQLLLATGAKLDAHDNFGKTALMKAREQKHAEATKVLEEASRAAQGKRATEDEMEASNKKGRTAGDAEEEDEDEDEDDEDDEDDEEELPLPPGWKEVFDDEGDPYYVHPDGVTTQWQRPAPDEGKPTSAS